ncbi:MAG: rhodanese-like domain-containing protein [Candidatus Korobacteraceae bacterium]
MKISALPILVLALALFSPTTARAQSTSSVSDLAPGSPQVISPDELLPLLQSTTGQKPLVLSVGPSLLYMQAHIPGAEYIGAASGKPGLDKLRARVKSLPHDRLIILYCGCCPWSHCPNVLPAYHLLNALGFNHVKVLYIANNFGTDWVDKGYPTIKGK